MEKIANFLPISDSIATAGQPTKAQLREIHKAGYQVVINLAMANSTNAIPQEQKIVTSLGMKYIHIPVIWSNPTLANFQEFSQAMISNQEQKIFVHCAANMRVSAFMYLYRLQQGINEQEAKQDLNKIWQPNPIWQNFINEVVNYPH